METKYNLKVNNYNNSYMHQIYSDLQNNLRDDLRPLVWFSEPTQNTHVEFSWAVNYSFEWNETTGFVSGISGKEAMALPEKDHSFLFQTSPTECKVFDTS